MVFGLGRKNHTVKVKARGRGTAPPPELLVPNAMITAPMVPQATGIAPMAPMGPMVAPPTYSTVTTLPGPIAPMAPMAPIAPMPAVAPPPVAPMAPTVMQETYLQQYATPPPAVMQQQIIQQQAPPPPLPAGYESDEDFMHAVKNAAAFEASDDDASSYTSFEEEVYCIVPPGVRAPRDLPRNSYRHGYRVRGGPEIIDYEGPSPAARPQLARRRELYSYTDIPAVRNSRFTPSPRLDGMSAATRAYRTERFDQPSPGYGRRLY